jgi:hypothetical protein
MLTPLTHVCAEGNGKEKLEGKSPLVHLLERGILAEYYCTVLSSSTTNEGNKFLWLLKMQLSGNI